MPRESKWKSHRTQIVNLLEENDYKYSVVGTIIGKELGLKGKNGGGALASYIKKVSNEIKGLDVSSNTKTSANDYNSDDFYLSALDKEKGEILSIEDFCDKYNLNFKDLSSYKFLPYHYKEPSYNVVFKPVLTTDDFDYIKALKKKLKGIKPKLNKVKGKGVGVITLTDFHFGSYVQAMNITPEFSITILCEMLNSAAERVNRVGFSKVHIHLLGDLIESFTGMNHKNSWKGLDKGMFGVSAVKLFVKLFKKHFLDLINNLETIKMVAGNHDRVTSDNNEDTDGGAAELIAWGLDLIGYNVEFKRDVLAHKVDGINYILNHGHLPLTKNKSTQEICWMYGEKGVYNFITEGHLHSRIAKLNAKQISNFKTILDDNIDCRRQVCPSLFTGNPYSEDGGWSTLAGFLITEANINRNGIDVLDVSL